ncbi:MAG: sulfate ABC transporter substrate-binding protein [Alphaproteobacteria bacterium]
MRFLQALLFGIVLTFSATAAPVELLNVSYDPTRAFYEEYNAVFAKYWKEKAGQDITISQSHGGSGKQARSVMEGLQADVVTLALAYDIDVLASKGKLLPADWQNKFANNSSPYTSTIVFLVKKGNPKNIKDWDDLIRSDVQVITPNPKTSGGARWNYLAAWAYASEKFAGDEVKVKEFVAAMFKNVPVLDSGARGSTTTFIQRGIGDVLVTWENEAFLAQEEVGKGQFDMVLPSISIKTEPPVAVVEKYAASRGTTEVAKAYLEYLYSPAAQEIIAKHYFRPTDKTVAAKYAARYKQIRMVNIKDLGGWAEVQKKHFDDSGIFDQIYSK